MKIIAIIPARYASTRFPGKPLALLGGKPVIRRVCEQVGRAVGRTVVATDDERILTAVRDFGGEAVMTSPDHRSGTDRCYEAYHKLGEPYDIVLNVQGDEPVIRPEQIDAILRCFDDPDTDIATLVKPFRPEDGLGALENPNSPKVIENGYRIGVGITGQETVGIDTPEDLARAEAFLKTHPDFSDKA